jgi:hypothetical protein
MLRWYRYPAKCYPNFALITLDLLSDKKKRGHKQKPGSSEAGAAAAVSEGEDKLRRIFAAHPLKVRYAADLGIEKVCLTHNVHKGLITLAFWMCSLDVRFTVECVFDVIFEFLTLKITLKTHHPHKAVIGRLKRTFSGHLRFAFSLSFCACFLCARLRTITRLSADYCIERTKMRAKNASENGLLGDDYKCVLVSWRF